MEIPFTLTNVSFGRNTYQIKGFDQEYTALFNLISTPPGYISPGVSVPLTLQFTAKYNSPISCNLHFLSATGAFDIKVECIPRSINIQFEPFETFDLGSVTLGEEVEGNLLVRNTGALKANWSVSLEQSVSESNYLTLQEAEKVLSFSSKHGTISGYSAAVMHITYKPERPSPVRFILRFKFTSPDKSFDSFTRDLPLIAVGADLPVFLETEKIDFGVVFYKELFRAPLVAHNRSNLSQRFNIIMPPHLERYIDFQPKMGFIQPLSSLQITVKVRIDKSFKNDFPQFDTPIVSIPLKLEVVNQVLPVNFNISFAPSPTALVFDPPSLDFGTFVTSECKQLNLKVTSMLQVPVNFGFVRLPNGVTISPFDGFGLLMPNESLDMKVGFQSQLAKKHDFELNIATLQGSKFIVKCTANVVSSPILLSATDINFEATQLGEESQFSLQVLNTRGSPVQIQFETPEDFYFDPVVATVPPSSSIPVLITFRPSIPLQQIEEPQPEVVDNKKEKKKPDKKKDAKSDKKLALDQPIEKSQIISKDFTYKIHDLNIACFWKMGGSNGRHHMTIKAAAILPQLFITKTVVNRTERKCDDNIDLSLRNINFGVVALGQSIDAYVTLMSASRHKLHVVFESEAGSFEVLSPPTVIPPLKPTVVHIRFTPAMTLKFTSTIVIREPERPNYRITLKLSGEGAAPSIDLSTDKLDFQNILVGQSVSKSIQVKNNATFALKYIYTLAPGPSQHHINMDLNDAFAVATKSEWLEPGQTGTATVIFTPDHDDLEFGSRLIISAGEDGRRREIPITGSAWPHVMFVMGGVEEPRLRTAFDHAALDEPYFRPRIVCEMSYPGPAAQATLHFGVSQQGEDVKKTNGDFTFDNLPQPGFTVTPMKAAVEAGGTTKCVVEYAPPASSLLQVGQWVVCETAVNLKCGDFTRKVPVKLKCLINLQQSADLSQQTNRGGKAPSKKKSRK